MKKYMISVLTIQGRSLVFNVNEYKITEGHFIEFFDERTKKKKKFHASRCEIDERTGEVYG